VRYFSDVPIPCRTLGMRMDKEVRASLSPTYRTQPAGLRSGRLNSRARSLDIHRLSRACRDERLRVKVSLRFPIHHYTVHRPYAASPPPHPQHRIALLPIVYPTNGL